MKKDIRPGVLLVKENKILVAKSKYSTSEFYLLPGGGIEDFESVEETAIREVKEETNYDIKIIKLIYVKEWIVKDKANHLDMIFLGEIVNGKETHLKDPCLEKGHILALEWKTIEELKKEKFYPDILEELEKDINNNFQGKIYLQPER